MPDTKTVSFKDTGKAFASKTNSELNSSLRLFNILKSPSLVRFLTWSTRLALQLHLPIKTIVRKTIFNQFCGGESLVETRPVVQKLQSQHVGAILDYSVEATNRTEDFENTRHEMMRIIDEARATPAIPYTSLKLTGIFRDSLLESLSSGIQLNADEKKEYHESESRLSDICFYAFSSGISLYIDAEESWIQDEIDQLTEQMMRKYNSERPIVQTTLQMYRHDRMDYLLKIIADARKNNYKIGVKLVRGAYMEKENERAKKIGYPTPIHPSKVATDNDFNLGITTCLDNIDIVSLCCGTHNEESTLFLLQEMEKRKISSDDKRVYFSQLYGMSDNITYNLADAGYNVTKYLPYGPVNSVVPYLIRRAEENTAIAGQMGRELNLLMEEKQRRKTPNLLSGSAA